MKTEILKIDYKNIDTDKLIYASEILKSGGLVAFPTETVYGLGANALDSEAVNNIFKAKGRPQDNPLIVHISENKALESLCLEVLPEVQNLIEKFWPGPLTLIFEKSPIIPDIITAGLKTVAVRMPSHPIALALIENSGVPIAAPSANSSGKPSPTLAKHVIEDLFGKIDLIIDGGASDVGLESTVLDIVATPPMILRPGAVTLEELKLELGEVKLSPQFAIKSNIGNANIAPKSPGTKYKHYSPKGELFVFEGKQNDIIDKINELVFNYSKKGTTVGILATKQTKEFYNKHAKLDNGPIVISMGDRNNPGSIAANLFNCFREFDQKNIKIIFVEAINNEGIGFAVMNRINMASGYNIIKV